jgi:hypothetical protein
MLGQNQVTQIEDSLGNVLWSAAPADEYFYVEDISGSDNTLSIIKESSSIPTTEMFKSTDQTTWESMGNTDTTAITATVPANGKLYLKAVTSRLGSGGYSGTKISCTGNYNVGGYLTSLIFGDDFETNTLTGKSEQTFYNLFRNSVNLINAGKLIMPTTSLRRSYSNMFMGCTSLTTAPSLSQTAVEWGCFSDMFHDCTSLTTAPALPATTLVIECYSNMFNGCRALTTAPVLPATTLASNCYNGMFRGCTSLTQAPALPATTLVNRCYIDMFHDCTSLTTAPALPATNSDTGCYWSMFWGCTSLTTAPAINLTSLSSHSCDSMFWGCTSLTTAPALPATTLASSCYTNMFRDCTSLIQAPTLPATTLTGECYNGMFSGCTALTTAPALPATTLAESCYIGMFSGCRTLTTAPALPATTVVRNCYNAMFWNCASLTTAPVLPATTLATECYRSMFWGCGNLNSVTTYAQDISAGSCIDGWLNGVSASGNFYNLGGATFASGASGIPTGWTEHRANCNVSISAGSNGSVSVNGVTGDYSQSVAYNTQLTLVATPDNGYIFGSWSDGDTNATRTITVTNDLTLTTSFYLNVNYNVSISAGSNGSVSVNGVTGDYSQSVSNGTQLTLVATPDSGYVFDDWSDGDTNATRTITVTNDLTLTAAFEVFTGVPDYHIQYTTTDNNQLSLSNSVITNHTFTNGVGDITINTTTLPAKFFENKTTLRTLAYGGNIEFADGGYQHSGCENLESVDLPANMTYIPQRWFRTCRKLSRLDLPVSAMTWNISWPFYYTAAQTTEGVLHVYVHNSTTLPTMDYTRYGDPNYTDFYVTGNSGGSHALNIENLIRLHVPSSLYNDYITTAPHSSVASCISSY